MLHRLRPTPHAESTVPVTLLAASGARSFSIGNAGVHVIPSEMPISMATGSHLCDYDWTFFAAFTNESMRFDFASARFHRAILSPPIYTCSAASPRPPECGFSHILISTINRPENGMPSKTAVPPASMKCDWTHQRLAIVVSMLGSYVNCASIVGGINVWYLRSKSALGGISVCR